MVLSRQHLTSATKQINASTLDSNLLVQVRPNL